MVSKIKQWHLWINTGIAVLALGLSCVGIIINRQFQYDLNNPSFRAIITNEFDPEKNIYQRTLSVQNGGGRVEEFHASVCPMLFINIYLSHSMMKYDNAAIGSLELIKSVGLPIDGLFRDEKYTNNAQGLMYTATDTHTDNYDISLAGVEETFRQSAEQDGYFPSLDLGYWLKLSYTDFAGKYQDKIIEVTDYGSSTILEVNGRGVYSFLDSSVDNYLTASRYGVLTEIEKLDGGKLWLWCRGELLK